MRLSSGLDSVSRRALVAVASLVSLALLMSIAAGCGPALAPSSAFAELGGGGYDYRATTPRGVVIAARAEKNSPRADIDFWSRAVDVRLERDGYAKASETPIVTDRGLPGVELHFARDQEGRAYDYVVALFVKERRVYVVEAAGDREDFAPAGAEIERAIRSLRE